MTISPITAARHVLPQSAKNNIVSHIETKNEHRTDLILNHIESADDVLDIGCVQHSLDRVDFPNPSEGTWLHEDLRKRANDVHGIDIVESEIKTLNENGYSAEVANAESFSIGKSFNVIVAGELIEHLSNVGDFLDCCRKHIKSDGSVIITTPNPRRLQMLMWFLREDESKANPEHTAWYDHYVMEELASRHGFKVSEWDYYRPAFLLLPRLLWRLDIATPLVGGGYVFVLNPT